MGRMKKTGGKVTRCYVTLGSGVVPDCTGLRGREKPDLYEMHESREA